MMARSRTVASEAAGYRCHEAAGGARLAGSWQEDVLILRAVAPMVEASPEERP